MVTENKPMNKIILNDGMAHGIVYLSNLAKKNSVRAKYNGNRIEIEATDFCGNPIFDPGELRMYNTLNNLQKYVNKSDENDLLEITYEEDTFNVPLGSFNTVAGITKSLESDEAFIEMLNNRRKYIVANPTKSLKEFLIAGTYVLDEKGFFLIVMKTAITENGKIIAIKGDTYKNYTFPVVTTMETLTRKTMELDISLTFAQIPHPQKDDTCHFCSGKFTTEDFKAHRYIYLDNYKGHMSCFINHTMMNNVKNIINYLVAPAFDTNEYAYEIYPSKDYVANTSITVHTNFGAFRASCINGTSLELVFLESFDFFRIPALTHHTGTEDRVNGSIENVISCLKQAKKYVLSSSTRTHNSYDYYD